jgi:hypothetical protein
LRAAAEETSALSGSHAVDFAVAGTISLSAPIAVGPLSDTDTITIDGPGAATLTVDGGGNGAVFVVCGAVSISGLTVTGGSQGGITYSCRPLDLYLQGVVVTGNTNPNEGGGLALYDGGGDLGTLTISDSTISSNQAAGDGGGIAFGINADATISNSVISSNSGGLGAGIYQSASWLTISDSVITGNVSSGQGGALFVFSGYETTVTDTVMDGNTAAYAGGAISFFGSSNLLVERSVLANNEALAEGGGVNLSGDGPVAILDSTISGNRTIAGDGGGLWTWGGESLPVTIRNTTISANRATGGSGGGVYHCGPPSCSSVSSELIIENSTVVDNDSTSRGGAITSDSPLTIKNSIVSSVIADCSGMISSAGHNLSSDNSCPFSESGDLEDTDPLVSSLADNGGLTKTHALLAGSPAIDSGSSDCPPPATDQRGTSRPQGAGCDIGAYESTDSDDSAPTPPPSEDEDEEETEIDGGPDTEGPASTATPVGGAPVPPAAPLDAVTITVLNAEMATVPGATVELFLATSDVLGVAEAGLACVFEITSQPGSTASIQREATTDTVGVTKAELVVGETPGRIEVTTLCGNATQVFVVNVIGALPAAGSGGSLALEHSTQQDFIAALGLASLVVLALLAVTCTPKLGPRRM